MTLEDSLAGKLKQMIDEEKWEESNNIDFDYLEWFKTTSTTVV